MDPLLQYQKMVVVLIPVFVFPSVALAVLHPEPSLCAGMAPYHLKMSAVLIPAYVLQTVEL